MSTHDNVSYFSRFLLKFVEIVVAGLATAVSGYVIVHLTGALPSPAPAPAPTAAVIQVAPSVSVPPGLPVQPNSPVSANASEQRLAPQPNANASPVAQRARKTVKSEPSHKHTESAPSVAASTRDQDSFVPRVRAAITSADAPLDLSPRQSVSTRAPAAIAQPKTDHSAAGVVSAEPPAAAQRVPPVQELPTEANLPRVEINSRPIAETQIPPEPPAGKETSTLSTLEQMLRQDPLAGTDQPPRPPMPVGQ
jgi:hypothetical protein